MKAKNILTTTLMLCSLFSFTANGAEKLVIPLGKSVSIPAYGVKKILAVKDNVIDVLNVSDDEIIISGVGDKANATQLILWDKTGKRLYDVETYSDETIIHEKFDAIINNKSFSLKIFPDSAYLQGKTKSKEEKKRAEKVARSLVGNKKLISLIEYEEDISSLQQRIESAISQPNVKVSVISSQIDPNAISSRDTLIATDTTGVRIILQGSVKNQNDFIHLSETVKGFVNSPDQISNLVSISDPYQVMFQCYILQVTKKNGNDLGITWNSESGNGALNFIEVGDGNNAILPKHMNPFYMQNINRQSLVQATVEAWEESGKAKVISKPNLMVYASAVAQNKAESSWGGELNSKDAESDQGLAYVKVGQTVQVEKDAGNGKTSYETFDANLKLSIRDLYIEGDELKFSVFAQQEELSYEKGNGLPPDKHSRNIMTTLRVKDQQTVALGGLISQNKSESWNGIPGLSRIPYLGRLFRHRSVSNSENELIILLTPRITSKDKDLAGNKIFEANGTSKPSDRLKNLNNIFEQIKSSHVPANQ